MKRLVWLFLAVFCTALAQVQPVELPVTKPDSCCYGADECGCDMPECGLPPVPAQPVFNLQSPARSARLTVKRAAPAPRLGREKFYGQFVPRTMVAPVLPASYAVAPPASIPLFQEHCSLLI